MKKIIRVFKAWFRRCASKRLRGMKLRYPAVIADNHVAARTGSGESRTEPEWFRRQFEAAYPEAAKFLAGVKACDLPNWDRVFLIDGSILVKGAVSCNATDIYDSAASAAGSTAEQQFIETPE